MQEKTLHNSDVSGARKNVPDLATFGDGDTFKLICKASSQSEGWMKSTKAMEIPGSGCVVQVTTQQRNLDGTYALAEAVCFVPGARIVDDHGASPIDDGASATVIGRHLISGALIAPSVAPAPAEVPADA